MWRLEPGWAWQQDGDRYNSLPFKLRNHAVSEATSKTEQYKARRGMRWW